MSDPDNKATLSTVPDDDYEGWLAAVHGHFERAIASSRHVFKTDAVDLWDAYLDAASRECRQVRTCSACRAFVNRFGGLVTVREDGSIESALWPGEAPPAYAPAARALIGKVATAKVTGVFLSARPYWGTPRKGGWHHIAVEPPAVVCWQSFVTTAGQAMAAKTEERHMLLRGLEEFPVEVVRKAFSLLTTGALYRSEKCEGVAKWLLDLHERRASAKHERARENITWLAVASAPPGYCHVRSGMIGTLLEDLIAGLPFESLKARFDAKMHPAQYLRPQAAPTAGNIAQAEKIVAALGSAGALARRFARLSDVHPLWTARVEDEAPRPRTGVFAHLMPRSSAQVAVSPAPPVTFTWVKFAASVLPTAEAIELLVPTGKSPFMAMVTAVDPAAPPLVHWDRDEKRNPVSLYMYVKGSEARQWNLRPGTYHPVTAVVSRPWMWDEARPSAHHGAGVCLVLAGARDTTHERGGGMFPEWLKSEYHGVRATLEAHFRSAPIAGRDGAEVCGMSLTKGIAANLTVRVTAYGIRSDYRLDRWD